MNPRIYAKKLFILPSFLIFRSATKHSREFFTVGNWKFNREREENDHKRERGDKGEKKKSYNSEIKKILDMGLEV